MKDYRKVYPIEPYKGIEYYQFIDQNIFFGRDEEIQSLLRLITIYRGVLLMGQSGTGKSSLIYAGLIPQALKKGFTPDLIKVKAEKGAEILVERIIEDNSDPGNITYLPSSFFSKEDTVQKKQFSIEDFKKILHETKNIWTEYLKIQSNPETPNISKPPTPLLIFDQFEEIITQFKDGVDDPIKEKIFGTLRDLLFDDYLTTSFLFSFREDYYAGFYKFLNDVPDLKNQSLKLDSLKVENLNVIINSPILGDVPDNYKSKISSKLSEDIKADFTKRLNEKKEDNTILSEVQIVCQTLWRSENRDQLFEKNKTKGILERYFKDKISLIDREYDEICDEILMKLVVNNARNIVSKNTLFYELAKMLPNKNEDFFNNAVNELKKDTVKLVKEDHIDNDIIYYQITSEYLIPSIKEIEEEKNKTEEKRKKDEELKKIEEYNNRKLAEEKRKREDDLKRIKEEGDIRRKQSVVTIGLLSIIAIILLIFYLNSLRLNKIVQQNNRALDSSYNKLQKQIAIADTALEKVNIEEAKRKTLEAYQLFGPAIALLDGNFREAADQKFNEIIKLDSSKTIVDSIQHLKEKYKK